MTDRHSRRLWTFYAELNDSAMTIVVHVMTMARRRYNSCTSNDNDMLSWQFLVHVMTTSHHRDDCCTSNDNDSSP